MAIDINNNWIDNHLRFVLSNIQNKDISEITKDYLLTFRELDLSDCGISSLKGIEYATNINSINLSKNEIVDATLLSKLHRLVNLELSENRIEDVSFLNSLKRLKNIGLDGNNISSIQTLENLKNLSLINVSNNRINDLSFIDTILSKNVKIIATEQCVVLKPIHVQYGDNLVFKSPIYWNRETVVLLDNIQMSGGYKLFKTNKRPSLLYSVSKILIENIYSDCIVKADFYHEIPFFKSGILSGILLQPIKVRFPQNNLGIFQSTNSTIYGKLQIKSSEDNKEDNLKSKLITIINSNGDKRSCLTDVNGGYKICNLNKGRYTILFPFLDNHKYLTPSLYVCNLNEGEILEVNSIAIKK